MVSIIHSEFIQTKNKNWILTRSYLTSKQATNQRKEWVIFFSFILPNLISSPSSFLLRFFMRWMLADWIPVEIFQMDDGTKKKYESNQHVKKKRWKFMGKFMKNICATWFVRQKVQRHEKNKLLKENERKDIVNWVRKCQIV